MDNRIAFECKVEYVPKINAQRRRIRVSSYTKFETGEIPKSLACKSFIKPIYHAYMYIYGIDSPICEGLKILAICNVIKVGDELMLNCEGWTYAKPDSLSEIKAFLIATLSKEEKFLTAYKIDSLLGKYGSIAIDTFKAGNANTLFLIFHDKENNPELDEAIRNIKEKYNDQNFILRAQELKPTLSDEAIEYIKNPIQKPMIFKNEEKAEETIMDEFDVTMDDLQPLQENDIKTKKQAIICFCLDTSYSMQGKKMVALNKAINNLISTNREDPYNSDMLDMAIVTFGGIKPKVVLPFTNVKDVENQEFKAAGGTHMAEGVQMAIKLITEEQTKFKEMGTTFYHPILYIVSDGKPDDSIDSVASKIKELINNKKLKTFCVAYNNDDDSEQNKKAALETLEELTNEEVITGNDIDIDELFLNLSRSMSEVSRSFAGEVEDLL